MANEYLKWLVAPLPFSMLWLIVGIILVLAIIGWFGGIIVWTLPIETLRTIPVIRDIAARILRRKFSRAIDQVKRRHEAGDLSSRQAHGAMSKILRTFVYLSTGVRAQYMSLDELATSSAAQAAPIVARLYSGQFEISDDVNVGVSAAAVRSVIQSWN